MESLSASPRPLKSISRTDERVKSLIAMGLMLISQLVNLCESALVFVNFVKDNASMGVVRRKTDRHLLDILRFVWQASI
ncbi:hypothetical protein SynBIOSE41_02808 [Synechococcus sp. BIOS-E4-1]|uniref:hypothetical protein n=1 Tax=Synechococcus sp. BIOS-E4-1 TaxID=1400864 RepID=UPI001646684F|nr:hypothetical protein [Synechococcus sp. BIOS-E4-1]QNI55297.1 hypothetical protein SynBIOSE41_02808 [Synechococcus sp. BIOS-E4-1]